MKKFANRAAAGRELAGLLQQYSERPDVLVLGLPRGGCFAAGEVALLALAFLFGHAT